MNWFIFLPIWCGIVALYSNYIKVKKIEMVLGKNVIRHSLVNAIVAFLPIFILASLGDPIADTHSYLYAFDIQSTNFHDIDFNEKDWGFDIFSLIIKNIFDSQIAFRVAIALVHSIPIVFMFRKFSESYELSLFLFVASGIYLSWMMNGLSQFMAVTIIFASTPLLLNKKYFKLFLIILIACTIHQSAIIMFPIMLIARGKPFNKLTMLFIFAAIIAMWAFSEFTDLFETAVHNTQYGDGYDTIKEIDDGTNPIRVLVSSVPAVFAFIYRDKIIEENNILYNICVNMSIITVGVGLVSIVTSGIYIGRLIIYTQIFSFILLPKLLNYIENIKSKHIIYFIMIIAYLFYYKINIGKFWYSFYDT